MVSDCLKGETKVVWAKPDPQVSTGCGGTFDMAIHLSPAGPIDVDNAMSLTVLKNDIEANGFTLDETFLDTLGLYPPDDRIDYTCGCKLYYPDSPGAKL